MAQAAERAWSRPELIAVVRSRPEETVLAACKNVPSLTGPSADDTGCVYNLGNCTPCSTFPGS